MRKRDNCGDRHLFLPHNLVIRSDIFKLFNTLLIFDAWARELPLESYSLVLILPLAVVVHICVAVLC